MSGEIGIAGDIATGMLVGRAVEPHAGDIVRGDNAHGLCLNCGTALRGDFCHACGQTGHVHRTLTSIGHDLLHGVFHFEGKVWRTLPMLVLHPGELTRRYIAGERARFVSPLALFLFAVFLMFATLHTFSEENEWVTMSPQERASQVAELDREIAKYKAQLRVAETAAKPSRGKIGGLRAQIATEQIGRDALASGRAPTLSDLKTGWHALDKGIAKANANPGLALYKLQSSAYKYSWALIPLSVPFVALLFLWKRRFKLYDHAIFVTYSLSFMLFLTTALSLCLTVNAPGWVFGLLLWVAPPVHMFAQLRGAYSLRKRSAAWRTVALLMFAWFALMTFVALLLVMGLME